MSSYVLVADNNGDIEILQVAYETKWKDLCVMLQVKFDYETLPTFTYTDDEEDVICLDNQDALNEALKICKKNDDVLHVQIRQNGTPPPQLQHYPSLQRESRKPLITKDHIEMARAAMGNTIGWATNAVKSAFSRTVSTDPVNEETYRQESQSSNDVQMDSVKMPEEADSEPVLHEVSQSFQTNVKEVVESDAYDISVPTSTITDVEEDNDVIVKEPLPSTSEQPCTSKKQIDPAMLQSIREEVRMAISHELRTFRNEVNAGLTQSTTTQQFEDGNTPCTSRDLGEGLRSPSEIKEDIRKLKLEMREAKQVRKIKKRNDKAMKRRSIEKDMVLPVSSENETKKVRKYAASFICENLLDGSSVAVGQQFVKYWVLKNEGTITWDDQIQLKLVEEKLTEDSSSVDPKSGDKNGINPMHLGKRCGPEKVSLGMPIVESGNASVVAVTHVAPDVPCIYTSAWRLCHGDKFFGPRIWCSVAVRSCIENRSQLSDESLLSLGEQVSDQSYVSKNWEPARKISTEEPTGADDDLSNMLSFEMTAVGDCNKEASSLEHPSSNYNFTVSFPPQRTVPESETPSEITEAEVVAAQNVTEVYEQPASLLQEPEPQELVEQEEEETPKESAKPAEIPEESVVVIEDHDNSLNFHSIPHHEIIPEEQYEVEDMQEEVVVEEEENPEVLDTEEQEEFHDVDDTHSDVPSDFEVIPLPECFDTSKPLGSLEKAEQEAESMRSHLSNLTTQVQDEEEDESLLPPPPVDLVEMEAREEQSENGGEKVESEGEEEEEKEEKVEEQMEEEEETREEEQNVQLEEEEVVIEVVPTSSLPSPSSRDKSVAPFCLPVPQSVLEMDRPMSSSVVQDYSNGYQTPVQKTAPPQEPWIPQPIPLPRGVLDSDKPWSKNHTSPKTTPSPCPRSSALVQDLETDSPNEIQTARIASTPVEVVEDVGSPQICFPPEPENEEVDEFTLAPEAPTDSPPLPILVPPGYPVPPPTIPSIVAMPEPPIPQPHNPSPLEQLVDMGFLDIDYNEELLDQFDGDVTKVVNALVYRGSEGRPRHRRHGAFLA